MNNTSLDGNVSINNYGCVPGSGGSPVSTQVKLSVYLVTMVISVCGNLLVVCVVYRNRRLRTPTNYLITNMAVADFIMTIVTMTPTSVAFITEDFSWYGGWLGVSSCKLINFLQGTTIAASIFTLTAIAFERFNAIVFPLRATMRSRSSMWIISAVWYCSSLINCPLLFVSTIKVLPDNKPYCVEDWKAPLDPNKSPTIFTAVSLVLLYALPLLVIAFLYSSVVYTVWLRRIPGNINRSMRKLQRKVRKNVVKMLITVVVVFAVFWLPMHLMVLLTLVTDYYRRCGIPPSVILTAFILAHSTGAVNFMIYVAFSEDYKQGFKSLCYCFLCGVKEPMRPGQRTSVRTEQTTENRRSTSSKKDRAQDIELKKLTSDMEVEKSTPRESKIVKFDMDCSSG